MINLFLADSFVNTFLVRLLTRFFLLTTLLFLNYSAPAIVDTSYLKILYERCLNFDESKRDSICFYASYIEKESERLSYNKGTILSLRLKGICQEFQSDYEKAIGFYFQSLTEARRLKVAAYEISALGDLAIAYSAIKRPLEAKKFYLESVPLVQQSGEIKTLASTYNNLGIIYTQLDQYDSALLFLEKSLLIIRESGNRLDPSSAYNNIGNVYFKRKQFAGALEYFSRNYRKHQENKDEIASLWTDHINLADTYAELRRFDSAEFHAAKAMELASSLQSKSKEADSYAMLARLYEKRGNFTKAYQYLVKWYALDTAMVNAHTQNTIAELQERFNAKDREAQNKLLLEQVEKENYRNRSVTYLAIALGLIGILIAIAFIIKRNANRRLTVNNELIKKQNQRLNDLNHEKNSLISIVSHDLGTPFATIQMWGKVLESDSQILSAEQQKALQRIIQAGTHGQQLVQNILDVEKSDIGNYKLNLEQFDLIVFIESMLESFRPVAAGKKINLHFGTGSKTITILSDKQLLHRMVENLLSNAIKYSPGGRSVWMAVSEEEDYIMIKVRDEGVGISKEEIPLLFSKYSKLSSQPTAGETSTGLGLSIVKRIVDELNGKIFCESETGKGSLFTVVLKK